jgi:hypothetical protein
MAKERLSKLQKWILIRCIENQEKKKDESPNVRSLR